jgi:DNA-binding response OmpR family regulator
VPIIVVSGERDRGAPVELLDLGADDYVRKPFRGEELLARIRAALRRRGQAGAPHRRKPTGRSTCGATRSAGRSRCCR